FSMTVRAAIISGSGLLTAATTEQVIDRMAAVSPEAMYLTLAEQDGFISSESQLSLGGYDAIAVGIGMGREEGTRLFLYRVLRESECSLIIDAVCLSHIKPYLYVIRQKTQTIILTTKDR